MLPILTNSPGAKQEQSSNNINNNNSSLKRSSSMIFRIEHLLPSSSVTIKNANNEQTQIEHAHYQAACKEGDKGGVFVTQFMPKGTISECLSTGSLMFPARAGGMDLKEKQHDREPIFCNLSEGILRITPRILRQIRLAEDIHSYNSVLELDKGQVLLRLTQDLHEGVEIIVWFSEEISILMSLPFLTLANIQGQLNQNIMK